MYLLYDGYNIRIVVGTELIIMSPESNNDHHILHPRKVYKTRLEKKLRQSDLLIVRKMPVVVHNELHATTPAPKKLQPQEMYDALRLLSEAESTGAPQIEFLEELATYLGTRSLLAKQVGENLLRQVTYF